MIYAAVGVAVALCLAAWLWRRRRSTEPAGWSAGPIIGRHNYSAGVDVDADGSFDFPLEPRSVHYVTRAAGALGNKTAIVLRYRIDADPGVEFRPASDPASASIGPVLYLQREGDDWSGRGKFEAYRWWATFCAPVPITPGEHEIVASLSGRWTAVEMSNSVDSPKAFHDALEHAARIGFVFGGGTGYGHGVFATGRARFTLLAFELQG